MNSRIVIVLAAMVLSAVGQPTVLAQDGPGLIVLDVPYLSQLSVGDKDNTKNCGQTCGLMVGGYFNRYQPQPTHIGNVNTWLSKRFNDPRYLNVNGYYTGFDGRNELGAMLSELHHVQYSVLYGGKKSSIMYQLNLGRPVIVGVTISSGSISTSGLAHWSLVVGYDLAKKEFIMHEPGSSRSDAFRRRVKFTNFEASWKTQSNIYVPTWIN